MSTKQGTREEFQMKKDESYLNYWQNRMKNDVQFIQYMAEMYKKQQLDIHKQASTNRK